MSFRGVPSPCLTQFPDVRPGSCDVPPGWTQGTPDVGVRISLLSEDLFEQVRRGSWEPGPCQNFVGCSTRPRNPGIQGDSWGVVPEVPRDPTQLPRRGRTGVAYKNARETFYVRRASRPKPHNQKGRETQTKVLPKDHTTTDANCRNDSVLTVGY